MIAVLISAYPSAKVDRSFGNTYDTQAQSGSILWCFPTQVHICADDSGQTTHCTSDSDGDMPLSIGFGIVTDPSQVSGVT